MVTTTWHPHGALVHGDLVPLVHAWRHGGRHKVPGAICIVYMCQCLLYIFVYIYIYVFVDCKHSCMYHCVYIKEFEILHIYKAPRRLPSANQEQSTVSAARNDATVSSLLRSSRRGETEGDIMGYIYIYIYICMYVCMVQEFRSETKCGIWNYERWRSKHIMKYRYQWDIHEYWFRINGII